MSSGHPATHTLNIQNIFYVGIEGVARKKYAKDQCLPVPTEKLPFMTVRRSSLGRYHSASDVTLI